MKKGHLYVLSSMRIMMLGIDFPLIMNHRAEEQQSSRAEDYFYYLNGHNDVVYFSDQNFTPELIENYEYNPWGVLLTSANKNNFLYTAREFEFDIGLQFNRMRYYSPNLGRFIIKDKLFSLNKFIYAKDPINYSDIMGISWACWREGCYLICICWHCFDAESKTRCDIIFCWIYFRIDCKIDFPK